MEISIYADLCMLHVDLEKSSSLPTVPQKQVETGSEIMGTSFILLCSIAVAAF